MRIVVRDTLGKEYEADPEDYYLQDENEPPIGESAYADAIFSTHHGWVRLFNLSLWRWVRLNRNQILWIEFGGGEPNFIKYPNGAPF